MASPGRRSSRKKSRVSYDEDLLRVEEPQEEEKPKPRSRPPPKKRQLDDDESSIESPEKPPPAKKPKGSKPKNRGPVEERTCPHCNQVCVSKGGLKYHVGECV